MLFKSAVSLIKLLQAQLLFSDSTTMAALVNNTCKSFLKVTPGLLFVRKFWLKRTEFKKGNVLYKCVKL